MKTTIIRLFLLIFMAYLWCPVQAAAHPLVDTASARQMYERGFALLQSARYDSAIGFLAKADSIYKATKMVGEHARCLNAIAQCLEGKSSLDKALEVLNLGVDDERALLREAPLVAAQRFIEIGSIDRRRGKYDSAIVVAAQADRIRRERSIVSTDLEWDICTLYAGIYFDLGEHDSSLAYNERALRLFPSPDADQRLKISATYNSIAQMYEARGDYRKALEYFSNSLEMRRSVIGEKHPDIGRSYNNIAAAHMRLGDYDISLEYYMKAMSIFSETLDSDHPSVGIGYNNIAMVYRSTGDFDKALDYGVKSRDLFIKKLGPKHPNVAGVVNNIGRTYADMGKYDRALESYQQALPIWEERLGQKHPNVTQCYFNIGEAYGKLGEVDKALFWLERSLTLRRQTLGEKNVKVAQSFAGLGVVDAVRGLSDSAIYYYQQAIDALVDTEKVASGNTGLFQSASDLDLLSSLSGKASALRSQYAMSRNVDDLRSSLMLYERAADLAEQLRRGFGAEGSKIQLERTSFDVYEGGVGVALALLRLTHDTAFTSQAFAFAERSKAGVLADAITESHARHFAGIPDSVLEKEQALRTLLAYHETQLQKEKEKKGNADRAKIAKWENSLFDARRKEVSLLESFEQQYPAYHALRHQSRPVTLEELQKKLPDSKTAVLEYFAGDSAVAIFVVTKRRSIVISEPLHRPLAELVKEFRHSITNLESERYCDIGYKLYAHLLDPIAKELVGIQTLTIIPDGILHYLPFEALLTKSVTKAPASDFSGLAYLISKYAVNYQLSAKLFVERGEKPVRGRLFAGWAPVFADKPPQGNALLGAAMKLRSAEPSDKKEVVRSITVDGDRFAELKESENEVRGIAKLFEAGRRSAKVFLNRSATETELKSSSAQSYNYIHIATHGLINEEQPKLSGIIFARSDPSSGDDGVLYASEVYNLRLNAELVVLSACQTGLGTIAKGEGILGMTRGFMYAGARNVLVSLWQVADKSTSELMERFYENILRGQSQTTALRNAKLSLVRGKKYSHPIEWSPFVLNGY